MTGEPMQDFLHWFIAGIAFGAGFALGQLMFAAARLGLRPPGKDKS